MGELAIPALRRPAACEAFERTDCERGGGRIVVEDELNREVGWRLDALGLRDEPDMAQRGMRGQKAVRIGGGA